MSIIEVAMLTLAQLNYPPGKLMVKCLRGWPASISMHKSFGPFSDKSLFKPFRMPVANPRPFTGIFQSVFTI